MRHEGCSCRDQSDDPDSGPTYMRRDLPRRAYGVRFLAWEVLANLPIVGGYFWWGEFSTWVSRCVDCRTWKLYTFYVDDALWRRVVPESGWLCLPCFERRLGRRVFQEDLCNVPPNDSFPWEKYDSRNIRLRDDI